MLLIGQEGDILAGLFAVKLSEPARMSPFGQIYKQGPEKTYNQSMEDPNKIIIALIYLQK